MIKVNFFNSSAKVQPEAWALITNRAVEGRWWYEVLERSDLRAQFKFWYAVLTEDGQPTVLAPFFLMNAPLAVVMPDWLEPQINILSRVLPSLTTIRTLFVGSPCADEGILGVSPDADLFVLMPHLNSALQKFARVNGADMIVWKDFREYLAALSTLCGKENFFALTSFPGSTIIMKSEVKTLDAYFATLDSHRRKRIKKKLAKSHAQGELLVDKIQNPSDKYLGQLYKLFEQTYDKGHTKFERLNITFFKEIAKIEHAWWVVLREPGTLEPVAFNLCFRLGDVVIQKFIGLNYALGKDWFLYFRLWEESMNWALSHGAKEIQSGQTGYSAKLELGYTLTPLTNFCHHFNPVVNKIGQVFAENTSWSTLDSDLAVYLKAHPELTSVSHS